MQLAYKYLSMATQYGEWDAYILLGDMYRQGIYVREDIDMALNLYTTCIDNAPNDASNDAYPAALTRLAECIIDRFKSDKDKEMARLLLNKAKEIVEVQIKEGNYYAPEVLERIKDDLSKCKIQRKGKFKSEEYRKRDKQDNKIEPLEE